VRLARASPPWRDISAARKGCAGSRLRPVGVAAQVRDLDTPMHACMSEPWRLWPGSKGADGLAEASTARCALRAANTDLFGVKRHALRPFSCRATP
jgi:hypothetical protein